MAFRAQKGDRLFLLFCIVLSLILTTKFSYSHGRGTLKEIYRSGTIIFKPVMKISPDTFPENVPGHTLVDLILVKDKIYVLDVRLSDVKMLSSTGAFIKSFGEKGRGPGDLLAPTRICLSKNRLVVWESRNRRFSFFSLDGTYIKSVKPKVKGFMRDMKSLEDGRIILEFEQVEADKENRKIDEWRVLELFSSEMKHIKTLYRGRERICKYFKKGPARRLRLPFRPIMSWDVLPGNKIVLGYSEKYEIKILDVDTGVTKLITRDYSPERVTEADKELIFAGGVNIDSGKPQKGAGKFYRKNAEFPEFKPAFKKIITDIEDNILVFFYASPQESENNSLGERRFDAFDSNGNYIGPVLLEGKAGINVFNLTSVRNNEFFCYEEESPDPDASMDFIFVKYKAKE